MRGRIIKFLLVLNIIVTLLGCKSIEERKNEKALSALERGNYKEAAFLLRDAIKVNPQYLDGMVNYRNTYPFALSQIEKDIALYKDSDRELVKSYEELIKLQEGLYTLDPLVHNKLSLSLTIPEYEDVVGIKKSAGVAYYNAGKSLEGKNLDRYEKRQKYTYYRRGKELNEEYLDIRDRKTNSRREAMVLVALDYSGKDYPNLIDTVDSKVRDRVLEDKLLMELVVFKDLKGSEVDRYIKKAGYLDTNESKIVNTIVKVNIDDIRYIEPKIKERYYDRYWDEPYYIKVDGVEVLRYRKRSYTEVVREKSVEARVDLSYEIVDLIDGQTIGSGTVGKVVEDSHRWNRVISGRVPRNVVFISNRNLRAKSSLIREALIKASEELGGKIKKDI